MHREFAIHSLIEEYAEYERIFQSIENELVVQIFIKLKYKLLEI